MNTKLLKSVIFYGIGALFSTLLASAEAGGISDTQIAPERNRPSAESLESAWETFKKALDGTPELRDRYVRICEQTANGVMQKIRGSALTENESILFGAAFPKILFSKKGELTQQEEAFVNEIDKNMWKAFREYPKQCHKFSQRVVNLFFEVANPNVSKRSVTKTLESGFRSQEIADHGNSWQQTIDQRATQPGNEALVKAFADLRARLTRR
jgi:ribosomal protein L22